MLVFDSTALKKKSTAKAQEKYRDSVFRTCNFSLSLSVVVLCFPVSVNVYQLIQLKIALQHWLGSGKS